MTRLVPTRAVGALALVVLVSLAMVRPADAQGTNGSMPDPISSRELLRYAERLELSPQQRFAMESIHDDYKVRFKALREGEIADFLDSAERMGGRMPTRDQFEPIIREMRKLQEKIRTLDEELFDRVAPWLTPEQAPQLPRVRMMRERQRYQFDQMKQMLMLAGRRGEDLSAVFLAQDFDDEVVARIDPMLATYERRLTIGLREMSEAVLTMYLDLFDEIEDMGFADMEIMDPDLDPEVRQKFAEAMQKIFLDLMKRIAVLGADLNEIDHATFRRILGALEPSDAMVFRGAYYESAYPEVAFATVSGDQEQWMRAALEHEKVSDEQREQLTALFDEHRAKMAGLADEAVELVQAMRSRMDMLQAMVGDAEQEAGDSMQERLEELRAEAQEALERSTQRTTDLLGPDLVEELRRVAVEKSMEERRAESDVDALTAAAQAIGPERRHDWSYDQFIGTPIGRRDLVRYADRLGFDEAMRDVLTALHLDYIERVDALDSMKELEDANRNQWVHDPETNTFTPPSDAQLDRVRTLRRAATVAIQAQDDAFFDEVNLVVDEALRPRVEQLRRERRAQTWRPRHLNFDIGFRVGGSAGGSVDLVMLMGEQRYERSIAARAEPVLDTYVRDVTPLLESLYDARLELQRVMDGWNAASTRDGAQNTDWTQYQSVVAPASGKVAELVNELTDLNEKTVTAIVAALDGQAGDDLLRAFRRRAYPDVYNDPTAVDEQLTRALALETLSDRERQTLEEIALAYRPAYEAASRRMIELTGKGYDATNFELEGFQEYQRLERQREMIRYERDELNFRTISRLTALLTPDQIESIGGLPVADDDS